MTMALRHYTTIGGIEKTWTYREMCDYALEEYDVEIGISCMRSRWESGRREDSGLFDPVEGKGGYFRPKAAANKLAPGDTVVTTKHMGKKITATLGELNRLWNHYSFQWNAEGPDPSLECYRRAYTASKVEGLRSFHRDDLYLLWHKFCFGGRHAG